MKYVKTKAFNFNNNLETSLQQMSAHKRLKRKNNDGDDNDEDTEQSVAEAAQLMSLLHRYARENLLLANIYIKVFAILRTS